MTDRRTLVSLVLHGLSGICPSPQLSRDPCTSPSPFHISLCLSSQYPPTSLSLRQRVPSKPLKPFWQQLWWKSCYRRCHRIYESVGEERVRQADMRTPDKETQTENGDFNRIQGYLLHLSSCTHCSKPTVVCLNTSSRVGVCLPCRFLPWRPAPSAGPCVFQ